MTTRLSIGDFARMTYLSVKALRHYHDIGVLEPAEIDPASGYRYYVPSQVGVAQMIRRLRDLGMPLDEVRTIVRAPDARSRDAALIAHLRRMERQLEDTQQTVTSLRSLLEQPREDDARVRRHHFPATTAVGVAETVQAEDVVPWWMEAFTLLHRTARRLHLVRRGPDGVLFPHEFFENEAGHLVAFLPTSQPPAEDQLPVPLRTIEVPATDAAVLLHQGPFGDLDRTYGALGTWVLERAAGADGPIREYYLPTGDPEDLLAHVTQVCWPVRSEVAAPQHLRAAPPHR